MKKILFIAGCVLLTANLFGCSTLKKITEAPVEVGKKILVAALPFYGGPKAKVAVVDFEIKAIKASNELGSALREALVDMLEDSDRFIVAGRQGITDSAGEPDLIITAAVTGFEPQVSGGRSGIGGGGGFASGLLGGLLGVTLNKACIVLEIRIVDAAASEVLAAQNVQGCASDSNISAGDRRVLGKKLSIYANVPMGKAIYACLIEAARYIPRVIPAGYYKY